MRTTSLISLCTVVALSGCERSWEEVAVKEPPKDLSFQVEWLDQHPNLKAVFFIDTERGWAVGNEGSILMTRDGGARWEPQRSGVKQWWLGDVHFVDRKTGWAVGFNWAEEAGVLHTSDGGATWTPDPRPQIKEAQAVQFIDAQRGWLMTSKTLLRTTDGGKSWSHFNTPAFGKIHFVDAVHGWATGEKSIFVTEDGGATWESRSMANPLPLLSLFFLNPSTGWTATYREVLRTKDGGKTWLSGPESASYYDNLQFIDELRGWATADKARVLRTSDGGETWEAWQWAEKSKEATRFNSLHFASPTHGWAVSDGGVILATRDGGKNWLEQNKVPGLEELGFKAKDGATGRAFDRATDPRIPQLELNPRQWRVSQILFANTSTGWAVGIHQPDSEGDPVGVVLSTVDGGVSWEPTYLQWKPTSKIGRASCRERV